MLLMMVFWWWYVLHVLVDDFWVMVPKVPFNFCNCEICGNQGQRFRRISLRAIEWIFLKTGGWRRQRSRSIRKVVLPQPDGAGLEDSHDGFSIFSQRSWNIPKMSKELVFPSKKYPLVNLHNYGKSPFIIGRPTINGPISIVFCMFTRGYMISNWGISESIEMTGSMRQKHSYRDKILKVFKQIHMEVSWVMGVPLVIIHL